MARDSHELHAALEQQYTAAAPALLAWAKLRLPAAARGIIAPDDLAQEVWLRAVRLYPSFDAATMTFRFWLFAVAKNVLFEVQRQQQRCGHEQAFGGSTTRLFALQDVPADITSITRRVAADETVQRFVARVGELEPKEQATLIHIGFEDLGVATTAERLGEPYATTQKRWLRLRERMRGWASTLDLADG
jgi:RNA polymerase sigma factor (sigma-70 family)